MQTKTWSVHRSTPARWSQLLSVWLEKQEVSLRTSAVCRRLMDIIYLVLAGQVCVTLFYRTLTSNLSSHDHAAAGICDHSDEHVEHRAQQLSLNCECGKYGKATVLMWTLVWFQFLMSVLNSTWMSLLWKSVSFFSTWKQEVTHVLVSTFFDAQACWSSWRWEVNVVWVSEWLVHADALPSSRTRTVQNWSAWFQTGHLSTKDDPRTWRINEQHAKMDQKWACSSFYWRMFLKPEQEESRVLQQFNSGNSLDVKSASVGEASGQWRTLQECCEKW